MLPKEANANIGRTSALSQAPPGFSSDTWSHVSWNLGVGSDSQLLFRYRILLPPSKYPMRILLIDNYDSFTWNLAHLLMESGAEVLVHRNDALSVRDSEQLEPEGMCISPGPGTPSESGRSAELVRRWAGLIPVLGVCLGMQVINEVYGGHTGSAPRPVHGKTDDIHHDGQDLFSGCPNPLRVARYHSLAVTDVPDCLRITARSDDGVPMALRHTQLPVFGLQFHPESFLTDGGRILIDNYLALIEKPRS